jgi:hypothetical protein
MQLVRDYTDLSCRDEPRTHGRVYSAHEVAPGEAWPIAECPGTAGDRRSTCRSWPGGVRRAVSERSQPRLAECSQPFTVGRQLDPTRSCANRARSSLAWWRLEPGAARCVVAPVLTHHQCERDRPRHVGVRSRADTCPDTIRQGHPPAIKECPSVMAAP